MASISLSYQEFPSLTTVSQYIAHVLESFFWIIKPFDAPYFRRLLVGVMCSVAQSHSGSPGHPVDRLTILSALVRRPWASGVFERIPKSNAVPYRADTESPAP